MIRFYSLFISDDDLLASPYTPKFNFFHDITLRRGETETVNFLLQTPVSKEQQKKLNIICDPLALDVHGVEVKSFKHQTMISITLTPKMVGNARIGIAFPQFASRYQDQMSNLPSPMVSIPFNRIREKTEANVSTPVY